MSAREAKGLSHTMSPEGLRQMLRCTRRDQQLLLEMLEEIDSTPWWLPWMWRPSNRRRLREQRQRVIKELERGEALISQMEEALAPPYKHIGA